ncbi:mucin-19-like [Haliotis cracherodii]|uniref:mucin-19-like n=1 Tax=Haliotis cracherodii TaxID=6455 RepID=UPI0039E72FB3
MKFTTVILLLGALLGTGAACSLASCTLTGTLTGTAGCTNYQTYISCLSTQSSSCTSSSTDVIAKQVIDAAITANNALRAALSCSTGSGASCSLGSCSLTGALTGTTGCTNYQTYISCLSTQSSSCTGSFTDVATKQLIDVAITSNNALRAALGCSGASFTSVSGIALILSVMATLLKTHF